MSLHGVGVDVTFLDRIRRFADEHAARLPEMFSEAERASPRKIAEAFALKEATLKALGGLTGWELDWREIETGGKGPSREIVLAGKLKSHARSLSVGRLWASVTEAAGAVVATVIAEAVP